MNSGQLEIHMEQSEIAIQTNDWQYLQLKSFQVSRQYPSLEKYMAQPLDKGIIQAAIRDASKTSYRSHYCSPGKKLYFS